MPEKRSSDKSVSSFVEQLNNPLPSLEAKADTDWTQTIDNLLSLAKWANNAFEYERATEYLRTLEQIWDSKGLPQISLDLRFELHREKGKALASQGKHEDAITEYQKLLNFCRDSEHLDVKSDTFTQIGQLLSKMGEHDRALGYLQRAIGAYRRLKNHQGICKALRNIGVIYVELGEFEEAELAYDEAIELAHSLNQKMLYADLVNNLGTITNMKGDWKRALKLYRESLEIYIKNNEIRKSAYTMNNLAITLLEQNQSEEAFDYFKKAYEIAIKVKDSSLTLIVDINLADLYLKKGELSEATEHCMRAEQYLISVGTNNGQLVEAKKTAGKIACHEENYDAAMVNFDAALVIAREVGTRFLEAEVLMERGMLFEHLNRSFDALEDMEASYNIYTGLKAEGKREQIETVISSIEELYLKIFDSIATEVDYKDPYTKGHSDRVASLALLLGREIGAKPLMLKTIVAGGLLHDIGKIKIDDSILKKEGKLTDDEFKAIQKHPELGIEVLRGREFPWDVRPIVLHHHEKLDGSGYPHGLAGEDIPLAARIVCISDVFDALTSDRVYRKAFDTEKALSIMEGESGTSFDPVLLKCFCTMIRQGRADLVINSRTDEKEMYSIWSRCTRDENMIADDELSTWTANPSSTPA